MPGSAAIPCLIGHWDFIGKPDWPLAIRLLRDASVLFFFAAAVQIILLSLRLVLSRWRAAQPLG